MWTFTATATNGGTTPTYQWKLNSAYVGTNSNTYVNTTLSNGDIVTVEMISNATCPNPALATAGNVSMTVNALQIPSVAVGTDVSTVSGPWRPILFTATPTNAGTAPTYQWRLNGTNISGATNSTYQGTTNDNLADGDIICVLLTSNAVCPSPDTATDCAAAIQINLGTESVTTLNTLSLYPNPNNGSFTLNGTVESKNVEIKVSNQLGQVVYAERTAVNNGTINKKISLGQLASGNYILHIIGDKGSVNIPFIMN